MLQVQASDAVALYGSQSKCHVHFFKKLPPLRLRETDGQPDEAGQQSILIGRLQAHSSQKIRADHLQAVAPRLVSSKH